jgi:acyl carrier protein
MSSLDFIRNHLVEKFDVKPEAIKPEATLGDLGIDSLSAIEIVFDISDRYGIDISDDQAKFNTLGEFIAVVDELVQAKRA